MGSKGYVLGLWALYFALAFGARTILHLRRTGSSGFKGIRGRPGSLEWSGGVLFLVSFLLSLSAPVLSLRGKSGTICVLDVRPVQALGFALYGLGLAGTLIAQLAMGRSWRIGVDPAERTELVTRGPFTIVRNPIFSAMICTSLGLALLVANGVALAGFLALIAAIELQVRFVEEPYLRRMHGEEYAVYASAVGRFVPGLGRLTR